MSTTSSPTALGADSDARLRSDAILMKGLDGSNWAPPGLRGARRLFRPEEDLQREISPDAVIAEVKKSGLRGPAAGLPGGVK